VAKATKPKTKKVKVKVKTSNRGEAKASLKTKIKPKLKAKSNLRAKSPAKIKKAKSQTQKQLKTVTKKKVNSASTVKPTPQAKPTANKKGTASATAKKSKPTSYQTLPFVFSPLDDRILVRLLPAETVTPGGIIIPEMAASESQGYYKAEVIAVGPGRKDKRGRVRPLDVSKGEKVLFKKYAGERIDINGSIHFILRESDVLGVTP